MSLSWSSNYFKSGLANLLMASNDAEYPNPLPSSSTVYMGLFTTIPTRVGETLTDTGVEPDDGTIGDTSYARQAVTFGAPVTLDASFHSECTNTNTIQFPSPAVAYTIKAHGLWDAATGGNLLQIQEHDAEQLAVTAGRPGLKISPGQLSTGITSLFRATQTSIAHGLLNHVFRGIPFSLPDPIYAGLLDLSLVEITDVGYHRELVLPFQNTIEAVGVHPAACDINNGLDFGRAVTGYTIGEVAFYDAATAGNFLFAVGLDGGSVSVVAGASPKLYRDGFRITCGDIDQGATA